MATKQSIGANAPDGSVYVVLADGAGNTVTEGVVPGSTPIVASSGNVAAAVATATLAGAAGKTTYITGFQFRATGATAATKVLATVTGLVSSGTQTYVINVPATSAALDIEPLTVSFYPPIPASAANTAIVVSVPSLGAGNTNACVNAQGYQL